MKLNCTNCNYQYTPKSEKIPARCPYCDKTGTVEKVKEMQEWIDEFSSQKIDED